MNAAIYARFSSDNQREESIVAQLRACREYCKRKGYTIIKEYTDEAFTARSDDRPAYQEMFKDAKQKNFGVIVFHKIDRNARNEYDYYFHKAQLRKLGIHYEYVSQNIDDSPEGQMMESVMVGMAAYYSRNLAKEVIKGLRENAYQAKHTGGKPPLGYDIDANQKYIINESEAETVRYIFSQYAQMATYAQIIDSLNAKGYRTKRGGTFGKNSLHDLLKNKKYIGTYTFGRVSGGHHEARNSHSDNPNMIEIKDAIPAIIDKKTWDIVQERATSQKRKGQLHAKEFYLLSGLVYCECGSAMVGNRYMGTHRSKGKWLYVYYQCGRSNLKRTCHTKSIKKDWLEAVVIAYVKKSVFNLNTIKSFVSKINKQITKSAKMHSGEIKKLENEKRGTQRKIDNLYTLAEQGEIDQSLRDRLAINKRRIEEINSRLSQIKLDTSKIMLTEKQVWEIMQSWQNAKGPEELKAMLQTFVKKVIVGKDSIQVKLKIQVASSEYCGDDLSIEIRRSDVRNIYFSQKAKNTPET